MYSKNKNILYNKNTDKLREGGNNKNLNCLKTSKIGPLMLDLCAKATFE